jgi:hypothetical protein
MISQKKSPNMFEKCVHDQKVQENEVALHFLNFF